VNRADLEHIIAAAATISGDDEIVVIGSQAVLGSFPDAPPDCCVPWRRTCTRLAVRRRPTTSWRDWGPKRLSRDERLFRRWRRSGDREGAAGVGAAARPCPGGPPRPDRGGCRMVPGDPRPRARKVRRSPGARLGVGEGDDQPRSSCIPRRCSGSGPRSPARSRRPRLCARRLGVSARPRLMSHPGSTGTSSTGTGSTAGTILSANEIMVRERKAAIGRHPGCGSATCGRTRGDGRQSGSSPRSLERKSRGVSTGGDGSTSSVR
jgi:hypothetical protein